MPRQKLTDKDIFSDFFSLLFPSTVVADIVLFLSLWILLYLISLLFKSHTFFIVSSVLEFVLIIALICQITIMLYKIKKGKYYIMTDRVIGYDVKNGYFNTGGIRKIIVFKCFRYIIHYCDNYKWSDMYRMSGEAVYKSANINDEFYLVTINKKDILYAYNTKFFEYVGDAPVFN